MATSPPPVTHRLCLASWELVATFEGAVIPRVGEVVSIDRAGREVTHRVTSVRYKLDEHRRWIATVFVEEQ
ncbi:MAG: hypothetical protein JNK05_28830 [Myxococcales bacterium]|nr:hypothetical protein [Myxococcales bacterium]